MRTEEPSSPLAWKAKEPAQHQFHSAIYGTVGTKISKFFPQALYVYENTTKVEEIKSKLTEL